MNTLKFKSTIKCNGCIATVTPSFAAEKRIASWEVDLTSPDRILTVTTDLDEKAVVALVEKAGYKATTL